MFRQCPKCGHAPLPAEQSFPAACPACGVILAKVGQATPARRSRDDDDEDEGTVAAAEADDEERPALARLFFHVPERVDSTLFWGRCALWALFAVWAFFLIRKDFRTGEIGESFIHRPLLIFHEAGHVLFIPFGEWMTIFGGSFFQLLMPAILGGALLWKNRDPFGASIGLWLLGVSLLDLAPYVYDALHPQLMLLSGTTGEEGGHDWIFLLSSMGKLAKAQTYGAVLHKLGALVVLIALGWGACMLRLQHARKDDFVAQE